MLLFHAFASHAVQLSSSHELVLPGIKWKELSGRENLLGKNISWSSVNGIEVKRKWFSLSQQETESCFTFVSVSGSFTWSLFVSLHLSIRLYFNILWAMFLSPDEKSPGNGMRKELKERKKKEGIPAASASRREMKMEADEGVSILSLFSVSAKRILHSFCLSSKNWRPSSSTSHHLLVLHKRMRETRE